MNWTISSKNITAFDYYYIIAFLVSIFFALALFYNVFQIHIYWQDSLCNVTQDDYKYKVSSEGRWINYILYPVTTFISGKLLSLFILLTIPYFIFIILYRWSKNFYYAGLVSLLFLQIPSFSVILLWPATVAPAHLMLLLSIFLVQRLPIYIYFILFGILFFGTMSNYYYLLPLLYLNFLSQNSPNKNIRFVFLKIIPAWATGFIVGYLVTQLVVYIATGHLMHIGSWRNTNYIHSIHDLTQNILSSFNFFIIYTRDIFSNAWIVLVYFIALFIAFKDEKKYLFFISFVFYFLIIIIHYIIIIPVGIDILGRTIFSSWVGILAIVFFIPSIKQWKILLLTPIILFFTFTLYERNQANLEWWNTLTNTYFENLIKESPKSPKLYKGVVLLASDADIQKRNILISKQYNIYNDKYMRDPSTFKKWAPIANEAGFKTMLMCNGSKGTHSFADRTTNVNKICQELSKVYIKNDVPIKKDITFYHIIGEYDRRLIISFNEEWNYE